MDQIRTNYLHKPVIKALSDWEQNEKTEKLWQGDSSLWTSDGENNWTGWLTVPVAEQNEIERIEQLANEVKKQFKDVVLLGMGGSSLCPDVMSKTFQSKPGYPNLHILDSTDPMQIYHLEKSVDLTKTLFIVSSKSGTTLEPNILKDYFYAKLQSLYKPQEIGARFIAITDPGTKLAELAKKENFREIFFGVPSIGGRYSALSNFGMVPSGLMGLNIKKILKNAERMAKDCSPIIPPHENQGILLGILLGVYANEGKDKVTLITSPQVTALGAWLEQLLAESTGKEGKGLIPVNQEELGEPSVYGDDRVFAYIRLEDAPDKLQDEKIAALENAGQAVIRLNLPSKEHLGAEFFRWEIATAVAGSVIKINAFNQPNVEASKVRTNQLMAEYEKSKHLPTPDLLFEQEDMRLYTDKNNIEAIKQKLNGQKDLIGYLAAHLSRVHLGDYVDISAFIERNKENTEILQKMRIVIRNWKKAATCLGFGPRFLHSTGQAYKGGPNSGVFLQITAEHPEDIPIPGKPYTFGLVIAAQAQGDFEVLADRSRRVLQIHLGKNVKLGLEKLYEIIRGLSDEERK